MAAVKVTLTVDEELLKAARAKGLSPSAELSEMLRAKLGDTRERPLDARIAELERLVRRHGRQLGKLDRTLTEALAEAV